MDDLITQEWKSANEKTFWKLNCLVYAGAVVVEKRVKDGLSRSKNKDHTDAIKAKEAKVTLLRRRIRWVLSEIKRRKCSKRPTKRQCVNIKRLTKLFSPLNVSQLEVHLETLKSKLWVRSLQLRRIRDHQKRRTFNERYRCQGPKVLECSGSPQKTYTADQLTEYWGGVFEQPGTCDLEDPDIVKSSEDQGKLPRPTWEEPNSAVWRRTLRKARSWKSPGRDGIHCFWWKSFRNGASLLWELVKNVLDYRVSIPDWLVIGRTVLIPKCGCQGLPKQYRPITCLNTAYKLLTGVVTAILEQNVVQNGILPPE